MKINGLSETDAQILASMLDCVPVSLGEATEFLKKDAADLTFDGERLFKNTFSQMTSAKIKMQTATAYKLMELMSATGESKNGIIRKLFSPVIAEQIDHYAALIAPEKLEILKFVLSEWSKTTSNIDMDYPEACRAEITSMPVMKITLDEDNVPAELAICAREFLKSLFQLNNLIDNQPRYSPQLIEEYWEEISPDTGIFAAEVCPYSQRFSVTLYRPVSYFSIKRTADELYEPLLEMLMCESRLPSISNCQINTQGISLEDELLLQEIKSIEALVLGGKVIPQELSAEGRQHLRSLLQKIDSLNVDVKFPADGKSSVLIFDLELQDDHFLLDGVAVSYDRQEELVDVIKKRLIHLSQKISSVPALTEEEAYRRIKELLAIAEEKLTDEDVLELTRLNIISAYYTSINNYSKILCQEILSYLLGMREMSFTIPKILLTLLNCTFLEKSADEILSANLRCDA